VDVWACGCVSSRVHMGVHMYTHTIMWGEGGLWMCGPVGVLVRECTWVCTCIHTLLNLCVVK